MGKIEDLQRRRFEFLKRLYEKTRGDTNQASAEDEVGAELGFTHDVSESIVQFLNGEWLTRYMGMGGRVAITHAGVKEVEKALASPDKPTDHFMPINILHIGQVHNSQIQQGTIGSHQTSIVSAEAGAAVKDFLRRFETDYATLDLPTDSLADLKAEVETIKAQMGASRPKASLVRECLYSIQRILEQAVGNVVAQNLLPLLPAVLNALPGAA